VGFFDKRGPEAEQEPEIPRWKPWMGAPPGWVGGYVPWQMLLFKTPSAYGLLRNFEAFPDGLQFSLVTKVRGNDRDADGLPLGSRRRMGTFELRLGVVFSDGRIARSDDHHSWGDDVDPSTPQLHAGGGSGGGGLVWTQETKWWLWPLPPAGQLKWIVEWEEGGVHETSTEIDASIIHEAATKAEKIWDINPDDRTGHGSGSTTSSRTRPNGKNLDPGVK
jgi:hypothetical protein